MAKIKKIYHNGTEYEMSGSGGSGIASIEQTTTSAEDGGTNVITVTDSEGNEYNFQVKNGTKGLQGTQGDQGASAVFDPDTGNILATLHNTTGQDDANAMTQKAVTDELDGIKGKLNPITGDYLTTATVDTQVASKYISNNGNFTAASSTTTYTINIYELPAGIDRADIYIPKTTASNLNSPVYGFVDSNTSTKAVALSSTKGNGSAQTVQATISGGHKYLVVGFNSVSGSPTVSFHVAAKATSNLLDASEIARTYTFTYDKTCCTIANEYISSTGTQKTGYTTFKRSDYLPTKGASAITITCPYTSTDAAIVAFYSSSKSFIRATLADGQDGATGEVPANAEYVIISNKNASEISITLTAVGKKGFNTTIDELVKSVGTLEENIPDDTLNILHLGNSFTTNTHHHLGTLISHLGVTKTNIQHIYLDGATLERYVEKLEAGASLEVSLTTGFAVASNGSLASILAHDWDVIIFQQASGQAHQYNTYSPYLAQLIHAARQYCTKPGVKIGFEMVWHTYANTFAGIASAARDMMADYNIDILIPAGAAVENARLTSMNTDANDFSSDSPNIQHLAVGVGRYVAACAFYCAVIEPFKGISLYEDDSTTISASGTGSVAVTADNRELCQKCAIYAAIRPYAAYDVENY